MMLHILLRVLVLTLACAACLGAERPNIVVILADDLGWKDLSCTGSVNYRTPHIDRLAAEGVRFSHAHSACMVCAPSRGALWSGRSPARTRFTTVYHRETGDQLFDVSKNQGGRNQHLEARHTHALPRKVTTLGQAFSAAGYRTGFFGKWHCGAAEEYYPDQRGFQVAAGYRQDLVPTSRSGHWGRTFKEFAANMDGIGDDDSVADLLTKASCKFIEDHHEQSFLVVLSHYLVHTPMVRFEDKLPPSRTFSGAQRHEGYTSMVETLDDSVGQVMETLKDLGLTERTLVLFTSDNGGLSGPTSNHPLMGGKSTPYEAGTRVPFILRWPAGLPAGVVRDDLTVGMDVFPTLLDLAGLPLRPRDHLDGVSLKPLLGAAPGKFEREPLVFHYPHYTGSSGPYSSILDGDWKLIRFANDEDGRFQLFNLEKDPSERHDLAGQPELSEQVERLDRKLEARLDAMHALRPRRNPKYQPGYDSNQNLATTYAKARKIWKKDAAHEAE